MLPCRRLKVSLLLFLIFFPFQVRSANAANTILTLAFENTSAKPEYNWIGESFSLNLEKLFATVGLTPLDLEERNAAFERLGLPQNAVLARATAIKVGEKAGADLLVVGTYKVLGEGKSANLVVSARVINVREGRVIGNEYTYSGTLNELQIIHGKLAWEIGYKNNPSLAFSKDQIVSYATNVPPAAFESYTKAILTTNKEDKVRFLFRAISESQKEGRAYTQAILTLGLHYYQQSNFKDAVNWLEKIKSTDDQYLEAQFFAATALLQLGDNEKAATILKPLSNQLPLYEVFNNAAIAELHKGDNNEAVRLLSLAIQSASKDDDVTFNYGYALWKSSQYTAAANQLNQLVRRQEKDGQAHYLLAKSLEKMAQKTEASLALDEAKKYLTEFAKWETGKMPVLGRIKPTFSRAALQRLSQFKGSRENIKSVANTENDQNRSMMAKANSFYTAGRDSEAMSTLTELLRLVPDRAEAHLLMGRIKERTGNIEGAINSLKAAIFWDPKMSSAHVLLGRIYLQQNNKALAEAHLKSALEIDPQDKEALALERLLKGTK
ncbi:MAG: tetratricopeptide repeat protein [Blastocatellia bacterium]|nr:tetratricopeptide repeat protein [Blastocatellia bacterium]